MSTYFQWWWLIYGLQHAEYIFYHQIPTPFQFQKIVYCKNCLGQWYTQWVKPAQKFVFAKSTGWHCLKCIWNDTWFLPSTKPHSRSSGQGRVVQPIVKSVPMLRQRFHYLWSLFTSFRLTMSFKSNMTLYKWDMASWAAHPGSRTAQQRKQLKSPRSPLAWPGGAGLPRN